MRVRRLLVPVLAAAVALGAAPLAAAPAEAQRPRHVGVEYLGETELPHGLQLDGTTVGGLSGISWNRRSGRYLLISDDRSAIDPARTYSAAISARRARCPCG